MNSEAAENLNTLLAGELAAVAAYSTALDSMEDKSVRNVLEECRSSHQSRSAKLRSLIEQMGGIATQDAGSWGKMTKMITESAGALGDNAILAALEEGEDLGSSQYEWKLVYMHGDHRHVIKDELTPEQQATHKRMSELLHRRTKGAWPPTPDMKEV